MKLLFEKIPHHVYLSHHVYYMHHQEAKFTIFDELFYSRLKQYKYRTHLEEHDVLMYTIIQIGMTDLKVLTLYLLVHHLVYF